MMMAKTRGKWKIKKDVETTRKDELPCQNYLNLQFLSTSKSKLAQANYYEISKPLVLHPTCNLLIGTP